MTHKIPESANTHWRQEINSGQNYNFPDLFEFSPEIIYFFSNIPTKKQIYDRCQKCISYCQSLILYLSRKKNKFFYLQNWPISCRNQSRFDLFFVFLNQSRYLLGFVTAIFRIAISYFWFQFLTFVPTRFQDFLSIF